MEKSNAYHIVSLGVKNLYKNEDSETNKQEILEAWSYVQSHAKRTFIGGLVIGLVAGAFLTVFLIALYVNFAFL